MMLIENCCGCSVAVKTPTAIVKTFFGFYRLKIYEVKDVNSIYKF